MRRLTWWFRIVGGFYLLLALGNLYFILSGNVEIFRDTLPFVADDIAVRAFIDGWATFVLEIFGLSTFMLWAARDPFYYRATVWLVVWLEVWHGVVGDLYLIANGYDAVGYAIFILIHLVIIITGILFLRQTESAAARLPQ